MDISEQWKCFISIMCGWGNTRRFGAPKFSRSACRCSWWRWTRFLPPRWPIFLSYFFFFLLSAAQYLTFVCRQEIFKGYRWLWSKTPWKIHPTLPISCHKHTHSPQKLPHMAPSALHDGSWSTTVLTRETHVRTHRHTHTTGIHPCGGVVFFLSVCEIVHITIPTLI